jgi:hypothetical protein
MEELSILAQGRRRALVLGGEDFTPSREKRMSLKPIRASSLLIKNPPAPVDGQLAFIGPNPLPCDFGGFRCPDPDIDPIPTPIPVPEPREPSRVLLSRSAAVEAAREQLLKVGDEGIDWFFPAEHFDARYLRERVTLFRNPATDTLIEAVLIPGLNGDGRDRYEGFHFMSTHNGHSVLSRAVWFKDL